MGSEVLRVPLLNTRTTSNNATSTVPVPEMTLDNDDNDTNATTPSPMVVAHGFN